MLIKIIVNKSKDNCCISEKYTANIFVKITRKGTILLMELKKDFNKNALFKGVFHFV